ncbi:MAG: hypothetical protein K6E70_07085 [Butyrivibrio sp.]|nr:hypothetical protein [Butyrivibrio sp.]
MCEALRELMKDEIDKEVKEAIADKDAVIADKDAAIASKDAEIAELKSKLEQLTK